ncbi:PEP-CTERM sorting domain-containing protein [Planctomycetota bacterium]
MRELMMKRVNVREGEKMKFHYLGAGVLFFIFIFPLIVSAELVPPDIIVTGSSATLITDGGLYDGWYLYEMNVEWALNYGLSHWDLVLKPEWDPVDHLIEFPTPGGYSTSEEYPDDPMAMGWTGFFELTGDPSIPVTDPLIKYNSPHDPPGEPDTYGYGTFNYFANIIPEYGTYSNVLIAKNDQETVFADYTGYYPSCNIVPEPATIFLLGLGGLAILKRRRA